MAVNKQKGLLIAAGGAVAAALPYLPKITTALQASGGNPKLISVLTAATIIYQAFKADPHKNGDNIIPASADASALPADTTQAEAP